MRLNLLLLMLATMLGGGTGCSDNQIGKTCNNIIPPARWPTPGVVSFINPAPDCLTRLCMVTASNAEHAMADSSGAPYAMCTAECTTDADCATSEDFKKGGCKKYTCAVPSVVPGGDFCCQKLCTCASDLTPGFNVNDPHSVTGLPKDADGVSIPFACTKPDKCQLPK